MLCQFSPRLADELRQTLDSIDLSADWIGLRVVKEISTQRSARDGLPTTNHRSTSQGAMVEVLAQGQLAYAATNSLTPASLRKAAEQAYRQAIVASEWAIHSLSVSARPKVRGQYHSPAIKPFDGLSAQEVNDWLIRICRGLKVADCIVQTTATVITSEIESWFLSSNGSEIYQKFLKPMLDYGATAQDGAIIQRRSHNGWMANCFQGGLEKLFKADLWFQVQQVGEQAVELLQAEECPTETTTLVLAPDQMLLQIHESIGHPLELDRILGDERNYAGGSFIHLSDFGHLAYGSPLMNVTFDPTVPGELASYNFDDAGGVAERQYLIKDGILLRGLGGLDSQTRTGLAGVACQRASSWNRPAIDRMANLNLEPGSTSFDDLIANVERGIYMESNRSWSIDDQRHKFQFGCEYARLIENGQFTKTLRNPNYRATTPQFWHSLSQVGNRDSWQLYGSPVCGKGEPNQMIWVGHGSPVCAFQDIEVFGGGS